MSGYNDILHLPHPVSPRRAHMSRLDRAAQFAPFAALTGYDESIQETARVTQEFRELEEGQIAQIDEALRFLQTQDHPEVTVTYFQPDPKKPGGTYVTVTATLKKIDLLHQRLHLTPAPTIPLSQIYEIQTGSGFKI